MDDKNDKTDPKFAKIWSPAIDRTPFEVVNKAIDLVIKYKGNFFSGVESIIVNPPKALGGNTKGFVTNEQDQQHGDKSKIIHIFVEPNKQEAKSRLKAYRQDLNESQINEFLDRATSIVIANTMVHEKEHVDNPKGGESTAEQKEKEFETFFAEKWNEMLEELNKKHSTAFLSFSKIIKLSNLFYFFSRAR